MSTKRHIVNVMRPTKVQGSLGEQQGQPQVICSNWPCSIKPASGNESEANGQNTATAQFEVEGYGDPSWTDLEECYLQLGSRTLSIQFVDDEDQNGIKLRLLCGEIK